MQESNITMKLNDLCNQVKMPGEVTEQINLLSGTLNWDKLNPQMALFFHNETWTQGIEAVKKILGEDANGLKMLTCMLTAGLRTYEMYVDQKISEAVYYDTFGIFSRFVKEHRKSYGCYGFDRDWWTCRQIAMSEFRIGELEYEMVCREGEDMIDIHIPSDTKLSAENCKQSVSQAKDFFDIYYPEYHYEKLSCSSWMLSPALKDVLPSGSNLLMFQNAFDIVSVDMQDQGYMGWIFHDAKLSVDELPQDTSLQVNVKNYLKNGGKIGSAVGYLRDDGFHC